MFEKDLSLCRLYDLYSPLLSEKKREVFEMYFCDDFSLSEIAVHTNISRQAVRDLLNRTTQELRDYEEKLQLFEKQTKITDILNQLAKTSNENIKTEIEKIISNL